jgi:ComF family protein
LIHRYKYQGQYWLSEDLLSLCRDRLEEVVEWTRPQWIVPVPLHKRKLRARRFDQSFLLARGISKRFGVPMADRFLVRTRNTRQQTRLNHEERFQNVRGAFEVADRKGFPKKSRMLLVDDVMTTGATVRECSRILKRAGAGEVFVFTVARA